jgi:hypothetical protein
VLSETLARGAGDERCERVDECDPSGNEGDPPDPVPLATSAVGCTVWFGPNVPRATERELLAMLGSRNGVAVLQWPRDTDRARRCWELGIPTVCFLQDQAKLPPYHHGLVEWLPRSADDGEVHNSLNRLSQYGAAQRQVATPTLDNGCLHLGACEIRLGPSTCDLAAVLVANFDHPVDDTLLSSAERAASAGHRSVLSDLLLLDRDINQIGLEVVPVNNHEHAMRRCGR